MGGPGGGFRTSNSGSKPLLLPVLPPQDHPNHYQDHEDYQEYYQDYYQDYQDYQDYQYYLGPRSYICPAAQVSNSAT